MAAFIELSIDERVRSRAELSAASRRLEDNKLNLERAKEKLSW